MKSQLKYEFDKKEAVLVEQQNKEREIAREKSNFQKIIIWVAIAGMLMVIIFAFFVARNLKTTKNQKIIIEEKQKEILDSIYYAKRIQIALMPSDKNIDKSLNKLQKRG